ncbi:DEAD-box ATP-dependent RNA helicase 31-like [Phoenix dactylifera]|uniref:ATP-dependent RNA helicase n=1 Tax=Phoenix dactylifera TaxID=42345 RepID=A0A8B7C477_PHODC|nr:DEAD-box ATP-dependent RNA helicase 31-like [Phoenix dactylifera]XP_038987132.1 DEAD-box ATP-dependent RNA helicase 31-like [Phoenix dactylifera]
MPGGELLPFRPLDSSGILRSPRCLSVLGRAFPFKLKYQTCSSRPRPLLFPRRWRRELWVASIGGREKFLFEDEAKFGDRISDRKTEKLDQNRVRIKKNERESSVPLKRQRDGVSDGFQGVDDRRKSRHFLSKKRFDGEVDEEEGKDHFFFAKQRSEGGRGLSERRSALKVSGEQEKRDDDEVITKATGRSSAVENESHLSQTRFEQCSISPLSLKGVKAAGYERMTLVQEATLPLILEGKDVLAKAKTGTGKTLAFLLPAIEVISKLPPGDRDPKRPSINVLVVCPTRELASQAAAEANKLLKFHPSIGVQVVIGGTRLTLEQKRMQANPCQILVATPGRLKDHIKNTPGFATRLMGVKVIVLDEADQLLDMGFRKDIENIIAAVPKQRQTLLFSATVPDEVRQICHIAMESDYEFINTVEEGTEETHSQVRQTYLVAPLDNHFQILYSILTKHISEDADYKVIVFCTTAMVTKLVADLLSKLHLNIREIHSRKQQNYRTRVSEEFRQSKGLILVSSDVSARGVDYPDVTLVIQVGLPADREQYIHRLGRTGRTGKEGTGILILAPWEKFFLPSINDLPVTAAPLPPTDPNTRMKVERALSNVEMKNKGSAYQAWLGYYNSNKNISRDKTRLVALANEFSQSMGLHNPPAIPKLILRKMGLSNVPGLCTK